MINGEENELTQTFEIVGGDFGHAGSVSTKVKEILKEVGIDASIIRRASIVAYEAEMNIVMYARKALFILTLTPGQIHFRIEDEGPGIPDIELAMQEGFSTATEQMREMGFGAGMGLPNIRKNSDRFLISSLVGKGTMLSVYFFLNQESRE